MNDTPATRRRFRFGLHTLLALVTVTAVASWGYWVAWPWWQEYQERMEFESYFTRFHVGMTSFDGASWNNHWALPFNWSSDGRDLDCSLYRWPNCRYVFWVRYSNSDNPKSQEVKLIKFPNPTIGYRPTTVQGQKHLNDLLQKEFPDDVEGLGYVFDLLALTSGGRKPPPGYQYELIYSDPPAKPDAK